MTSPWPTCIHGDDPTLCDACMADMARQLKRDRWNPWIRARMAWLDARMVLHRFFGCDRDPF